MTDTTSRPTVVFLNRFYWPDHAATAQILTDLTEDLARDGWDVRVIASRRKYSSNDRLPARESHLGVAIARAAAAPGFLFGMSRRIADYALYIVGATAAVLRVPRGSTIVGMTDPPLLGAIALIGARARGGRAIYWTQDIFPDIAGKLGLMREDGWLFRLAAAAARTIYRRADVVVALGPTMAEALRERGAPADKLRVIHNWSDTSAVQPVAPQENAFLDEHGLRGKHVILYSGNAGRAHTFSAVIESMRALQHRTDVVFVFVGGGPRFGEIEEAVRQYGLENVRLLSYVPRERLDQSLSAATLSLVTENPAVHGLLVPSKAYGILASGRPILFVGDASTDVGRLVQEIGCGAVIAPDDPLGLTATIERLCADPMERDAMGARARRAAIERFDRRHALREWTAVLSA